VFLAGADLQPVVVDADPRRRQPVVSIAYADLAEVVLAPAVRARVAHHAGVKEVRVERSDADRAHALIDRAQLLHPAATTRNDRQLGVV
jgi:hypothetical protein